MSRTVRACLLLCGGLLALSLAEADEPTMKYPPTKRIDHVDEYHGVKVADPYRWLEQDVRESKEVADWVAAENKVTDAYLAKIPQRDRIRKRLTELWNYAKYSAPTRRGRYFYLKNDGLQNQSALYTLDKLGAKPRLLLDPNKWSKEGTVALAAFTPSNDGKYIAYGVADAGSDWNTWHVLDVSSGKKLDDELKWIKYMSHAAWTRLGKGFYQGFYYSRFPEPKPGAAFQSTNLNQKLYLHRVGTPQSRDVLVYQRPDHPDWGFNAHMTDDGIFLIIATFKGTDARNRVTYWNPGQPHAVPVDLIDSFENEYTFVGNDGSVFYLKTDLAAPRGRLIAIDIRKPAKSNWKEIIPQAKESLRAVNLVGKRFIAEYLKDAHSQVKVFALDGKPVRDVELPGIGTAAGFSGKDWDKETFYTFSSFTTPPTIYRYEVESGKSSVFRKSEVKFKPKDYEVKQVFCTSKDGTRVPIFLSMKKGIKLDGNNPTLLYGYGGFDIPITPSFSISRVAWLEMGGVLAVANLRGGGEYGQEWHKAGTKLRKQNVFDDFIAAAQWLCDHKYTSPKKLAIQGRSNGGLLVGAVMVQRPELFGACLPAVGVMDMLRFQKFTAGRYWVDDYGSSDNPEEFKALYTYSPYHNLKKGTKYPATLVTTADTDDRVVPGHSFKFIARLQYCQGGPAPVLARIETRAGHGAGKPTTKQIEEVADEWAFLVKNLHLKLP